MAAGGAVAGHGRDTAATMAAMISQIKNTPKISTQPPQNGAVTHHQDHEINPMSFRAMKIRPRTEKKLMPVFEFPVVMIFAPLPSFPMPQCAP